jgi:Abnormal spindle-like microcephaly-assoc'd, ASPM-SPD-2-Hydin/PQQ-like domain
MSPRDSSLAHRGPGRRLLLAIAGLALALGALPAVTGALPVGRASSAGADDFTVSLNSSRTGWDPNEPLLSPATVGGGTTSFPTSPRMNVSVSGSVYAQPLVIDSLNEVVVATENDNVYGITATGPNAGHVIWTAPLGSPFDIAKVSSFAKCTDLVPNIGVTGTPVYDSGSGNVYMFANIVDPGTNTPHYYMVGLNASTGAVVQKIHVSGRPTNNPNIKFQAAQQLERPGVLFAQDGSIWAAFGSHCDHKPYVGFVTRVDPSANTFTLWSDESGTTYNQAGIWQGGGGVVQDPQGNIFVTSGNGVSPTKTNTPPGQLAESVIHLTYTGTTIKAVDFFSPKNAPSLDAADTDFGSGGSVALPFGTNTYPDVLAAPSKDGRIWLLNRNALGGREQGPGGGDNALSVIQSAGGDWGHPAVFADTTTLSSSNASTANDFLFYTGKDAHMQVFRFGVNSSDKPTLSNVANSTLTYGYESGSPVVTSNGSGPGSASSVVVWAVLTVNTSGKTGVGAYLTAYALGKVASNGTTPSPCTSSAQCSLTPIWTSKTFTSSKFSTPATSNGWVYIGTRDGHLLGYAAPTTTAPVLGSATDLGQAAVGASTNGPVTITAKHPVTITGVTASTNGSNAAVPGNEFTTNGSLYLNGSSTPVPLPVNLVKGDKLTAYVTFTPAAAGGAGGTVSFATSSSADPSVDLAVVGNGSQPGLTPSSATVQFMGAPDQGIIPVAVGITVPQTVTFTNFGTIPVTVTSVTLPAAPFTASNLPKIGTVFKPGQSVTVPLGYAPTAGGPSTGQLSIGTSAGPLATVQLNGTGVPAVSKFTAARPVVNFGTIGVGKKATAYVHITNSGNTESAVQAVAPLASPFRATLTPPAQMPFNPDADMLIPVTFTPTKKGTFSARYVLHWTDVNGSHAITVTLTGTAD